MHSYISTGQRISLLVSCLSIYTHTLLSYNSDVSFRAKGFEVIFLFTFWKTNFCNLSVFLWFRCMWLVHSRGGGCVNKHSLYTMINKGIFFLGILICLEFIWFLLLTMKKFLLVKLNFAPSNRSRAKIITILLSFFNIKFCVSDRYFLDIWNSKDGSTHIFPSHSLIRLQTLYLQ